MDAFRSREAYDYEKGIGARMLESCILHDHVTLHMIKFVARAKWH